MGQRFIARIALNDRDQAERRVVFKARLSGLSGLCILDDQEQFTVAAEGVQALSCGRHGLVLGTLFRQGEQRCVTALTETEQAAIIASRGQQLIERFWGPYVAFITHPDGSILTIRAPWGDLPCYRFQQGGVIYLSSNVDLLVTCADYRPSIAWDVAIRQLVHGPSYHRSTCLNGIEQLPGGERYTIVHQGEHRDIVWSPWTFAARDRQITDAKTAADLVRDTALTCIGARASQFEHVMVTLSGGLDSSIVAAALTAQHAHVSAMTLVTRDAVGDERHHASRVSQELGFRLTAHLRDVARVDVRRSGANGRPFPCVHTFFLESMRLADEAAGERGAQAIFNGGGGDTIFCSMQSGAPAADRLLAEGFGRGFLRTAGALSQLASASIPTVLRDAIARAWLGRPAYRHRPRFACLTEAARELAGTEPAHPWFSRPSGSLPGKALHVWDLAYFKAYVECLDPCSAVPIVAPLLSQPLVEACLRIPSWLWFESGLNRMVARRAFAGLLPPDILSRRSKGTPSSFSFEILETHRQAIRDMLVDGELARQGLIDLPALLAILDSAHLASDAHVERILAFLDVEAWAASWSAAAG